MIIAVDGYEANVSRRAGIGKYAYDILCTIYEIVGRSGGGNYQFRVYLPDTPLPDMPKETKWWKYCVRGPKPLWTLIGLPLALSMDCPRADVVFSPTHYVPRLTSLARVMAVMDTSYLAYPEMFRKRDLYKLIHWTKYAVTHAKAVFTISKFSKNAIIGAYKVPEEQVIVTYPGFSMPSKTASCESVRTKYNIAKHYILSVGTIQPRKNYVRLIEAFSRFLTRNRQKFGNIQLVIVGKRGWLYKPILQSPAKFGVEGKVKFLHGVTDSDLPVLYNNALCFALPSLYEGFGLPVLEAMAYKCPVVVSNVSSLPEIAGEAAIYVDPKDVDSIAQGLLSAIRQRNLIQGKTRIACGLERVKLFTWEKAAKQTLDVLTRVGRGEL
jgi:glycosyltransferase involved in cell wall biosynthesis